MNNSFNDNIYKNKYLTYKVKYLKLKSMINETSLIMSGGGDSKLDKTLNLFKAEWCPHCINFKPIWESIKSDLKDKINFQTYDSAKNSNEIQKFGVEGFPTIILTVGDKAIEYVGPRDKKSLTEFVNQYN